MIIAQIRRNADGVVRDYTMDSNWYEGSEGDSSFLWGDGNFACDCNRNLFFCRAADEDEPLDRHCGSDRFSVRIFDKKKEKILYQDDDWDGEK